MRIIGIESIVVEVPTRMPVSGVHGITCSQRSVLVRITTDAGVEGWGNVDPSPGYTLMSADDIQAAVAGLAPCLLGGDAMNLNLALATMDRALAGSFEAKAAIEMALCDAKARALGIPVYALLGGRTKSQIALNAWIGTVPPARAAEEALGWRERGFRSAKIKLDGADPIGLRRVAAVREAVGRGMALRVDFNESLPAGEAVRFIRQLEPYDLMLVEQPVPRDRIAELAAIRRGIGIPLMADESVVGPESLIDIIRREAADIVKVKVMKQGGLLRTIAMVQIAAAAGLGVVLGHGFGLTLSTVAEATVAAVCDAVLDGCEAVGPLKMAADVAAEPAILDRGVLELADSPGFGVAIDPEALARFRKA
ncbi:MAG TPA: enolase C-terminal domain-like protein [Stellaceae bacterium]|nr:enolase C-terminal domain-like protein [Stellaceae bacterium]